MRRFVKDHGLTVIFAVGIAVCLSVGYALEHEAFTPASPPGQAFAVAFVQDRAAALSLTATVNPDSPWNDKLTVHVKGAPIKKDRWLLVIECPPGSADSPHPGTLVSESGTQTPAPPSPVTVYSGAGPSRTVKLGCFIRVRSNSLNQSNTPGYASIGSVTLPTLETDQAIEDAVSVPALYADNDTAVGPVRLIQFFPSADCPPSATTGAQPGGAASPPAATAAGGPGPRSGSKPAAEPTAPPGPGIPGCFGPAQAGAQFSEYYLPSLVQTKETLTNVNLTGYQVESIFPAPQINSGKGSPGLGAAENYTWTGLSSLSPSLMVSNLAGQQTVSHYTFIAGVLLGIAGGAVATFLERIWPDPRRKRRRAKKKGRAPRKEVPAGESRRPKPALTYRGHEGQP